MLEFAVEVARKAGTILEEYYHRRFKITTKSTDRDLLTEADIAAEKAIVAAIETAFPTHSVMAEEQGQIRAGESDYIWVVDPLDGTNNFAHKHPVFCVAIALAHCGEIIVAVTFDPLRNEMFTAAKGKGAELNGTPISVSEQKKLSESIVATGFPYDRATNPNNNLAEFNRIMPLVRGIRRGGSAALDMAYVACGRLDGYWEFHLKPWDVAGGTLLVQEAGGRISSADSSAWTIAADSMIAATPKVYDELYTELHRIEKCRITPLV